jgi:hypothetical protein
VTMDSSSSGEDKNRALVKKNRRATFLFMWVTAATVPSAFASQTLAARASDELFPIKQAGLCTYLTLPVAISGIYSWWSMLCQPARQARPFVCTCSADLGTFGRWCWLPREFSYFRFPGRIWCQ